MSTAAQPGNGGQAAKDWIDAMFLPVIGQLGLGSLQEEFLRNRWLDQVRFAERKADRAQWWYRRLRLITITGGVIIPALVGLNVAGKASQGIRWAVFGLGLVVALAAAIEGFFHYGDRWPHYRRLAELLKSEGWQFFQLSGPFVGTADHTAAYPQFAGRVEEILQRDAEVFFTSVVTGKTPQEAQDHADKTTDQNGPDHGLTASIAHSTGAIMTAVEDPRPLCFVLMPFGTKSDPGSNVTINFDAIYEQVIRPAIEAAGLKAIRADEERVGGIIHKPMFERLILCDFAVADLTTANANVYYELGIRHAMRPWSTVLIFAKGIRLPFDLEPVRGLPYHLDAAGNPAASAADRDELAEQLRAARDEATDSPLFQLLNDLPHPDISRLKTDVFRQEVEYSDTLRERLAAARRQGAAAVRAVRDQLGDLRNYESGVLVDLLLSFRDVSAWHDMVTLVEQLPAELARTVLVREQYGLALNRDGQGEKAEDVLLTLIRERGPSSETYGILGRVYKDRYAAAAETGQQVRARGLLTKAIDAYVKGFESDWRDAYPGINAVELMELSEPPDPRQADLLPVVTYSVKRRLGSTEPDYWDYATLLELAILGNDAEQAGEALSLALAANPPGWQVESTLGTIRRLREARAERGPVPDWLTEAEQALAEAASPG